MRILKLGTVIPNGNHVPRIAIHGNQVQYTVIRGNHVHVRLKCVCQSFSQMRSFFNFSIFYMNENINNSYFTIFYTVRSRNGHKMVIWFQLRTALTLLLRILQQEQQTKMTKQSVHQSTISLARHRNVPAGYK